jgi:hypothetical protein
MLLLISTSALLPPPPFPQAGARLCKALGPEFLSYLPVVMPQLLTAAKLEPELKVRGGGLGIVQAAPLNSATFWDGLVAVHDQLQYMTSCST